MGVGVDISIRKQAEAALRESKESACRPRFYPFPIAIVDLLDDSIHSWSRSALTIFGHTAPTTSEWYQIACPTPITAAK